MTINQPDGSVLHCFASGDEYFNFLHDSNGYTIMQHPETGYYVYAEKRDGKLVATNYVAGVCDPASKGLEPYALISPEEWMTRRQARQVADKRPLNRDADFFGFINGDGNFCIFGIEGTATLQVVDVMGRILSSESFNGNYEKRLDVVPGVYTLRLINGSNVKVRKIVIE